MALKNNKENIYGDVDDSYNFEDLPIFYNKIKQGYGLVQGYRVPSGGGKIEKGAIPISHRMLGNSLFSFLRKIFFSLSFNNIYCGMKIIRNNFFQKNSFSWKH